VHLDAPHQTHCNDVQQTHYFNHAEIMTWFMRIPLPFKADTSLLHCWFVSRFRFAFLVAFFDLTWIGYFLPFIQFYAGKLTKVRILKDTLRAF